MIGIYKITSPSGKIYIGQSWNIKARFNKYNKVKCKEQRYLYHSLVKYGVNNHEFEILHELPSDITQLVLDDYEILYWELYKGCGVEMLNIKEPGSYGKHSEETKILQREAKESKKVYGFSDKGELLKTWSSIKLCAQELKVNPCDVRRTMKEKQITCRKFILKETENFSLRKNKTLDNIKNLEEWKQRKLLKLEN